MTEPKFPERIDLDMDSLGYENFLSAWLHKGDRGNFLVDPGPAATIDHLVAEMHARGAETLDWILLTHIHLDHAGGVGHLVRHFPEARVVCHEKAVEHLIDPARLQEGSLKVLGKVAEAYGEIRPVPADRVLSVGSVEFEDGITVIPSPGHAAHHQCFVFRDILFCGELYGVFQRLANGFYLRPATPPRFAADVFFASMDAVRPYAAKTLCFGHHGAFPDGAEIAETAQRQLSLWLDVIGSRPDEMDMPDVVETLKKRDPVFARMDQLSAKDREREQYFIGNSIKGIAGYLGKTVSGS